MRHARTGVVGLCLWLGAGACGGAEPRPPADPAADSTARESLPSAPLPDDAISGGDSDGDHIRDSVSSYIDESYRDDELKRLSARQQARALQHQLAYADDPHKAADATDEFLRAYGCMRAAGHDSNAIAELRARTIDTEARFDAYHRYNRNVGGSYLKLPDYDLSQCDFEHDGASP